MRKKRIMIIALVIFGAVYGFVIQSYAYSKDENDLKKCAKDFDCSRSNTCIGCNQCFSKPPLEDEIDCIVECMPDKNLECKCINGYCTSVKNVSEKTAVWKITQDIAAIRITYEDRQCIGNNGLSREHVKTALQVKGIKILKITIPKNIRVPICEACYPACSVRYEYEIVVRENKRELANRIINDLKTELPSRTQ